MRVADSSDSTYRFLVWAAIGTAVLVVAVTAYQYLFTAPEEGNLEYRRGSLRLEDGEFAVALSEFDTVLRDHPRHAPSHLGRALALLALEDPQGALQALEEAIAIAPDFAAAFANRGILHDRMGRHEAALADYRHALTLAEGPGWLTRFFRLQPEPPPTIADRAAYLERELAKPEGQRLLQVPEKDGAQRMYKVQGLLESSR
jgi:tetratricopeptide (TPR) repeat protein